MIDFNDELVKAFCLNYGIKNLLEDIGCQKIGYVGEYVMCCCPFHDERRPSFGIHADTGGFRCFTCNEKGSLYKFIKLQYHLSYEEVQQFLLKGSGLDPDTDLSDLRLIAEVQKLLTVANEEPEEERCPIKFGATEWATMHERDDPHDYLLSRGFSQKTLEAFQIGYTSSWKTKKGEGYVNEERVVIPGFDDDGNVIGFIGRTPVNAEPKYRYTYKFPKLYTLFNMHRAKEYGDAGIILVEGSLDAIRVHNNGFPNVCAILGADLSGSQINLLKRYTDTVFLAFDNDEAGKKCTMNAAERLGDTFNVSIIKLGAFKDPGEIQEPEVFTRLVKKAVDLNTYVFTTRLKQLGGEISA